MLESGDYAGADKKIRSLLADFPDIPQALNVAGIIADLRGRPEQSIAYFERAVSLRDDFIDARSNLARLYAKDRSSPGGPAPLRTGAPLDSGPSPVTEGVG